MCIYVYYVFIYIYIYIYGFRLYIKMTHPHAGRLIARTKKARTLRPNVEGPGGLRIGRSPTFTASLLM